MELTPNRSNVGRKKTSQEKDKTLYLEVLSGTSESFPMELSLITEKRRLTNVALLHLQRNDKEDKDNFFCIFISILGSTRFEDKNFKFVTTKI